MHMYNRLARYHLTFPKKIQILSKGIKKELKKIANFSIVSSFLLAVDYFWQIEGFLDFFLANFWYMFIQTEKSKAEREKMICDTFSFVPL